MPFESGVEIPGFKAVEDIVSMQRTNSPDEYSVLCANGTKEIVTTIDLQLNNVCPHKNIVTLGKILSMQRREDGRFDVICRQNPTSVSVFSAQQIRDGVACADTKLPPVETKVNPMAFNALQLWREGNTAPILDYPADYDAQNGKIDPDGVFYVEKATYNNETNFKGKPTMGAKVVGDVLTYPTKEGETSHSSFLLVTS